ncbi:hypothetical protein [uncultured Ilyobacter sp.]|uniref:hypothetical protein n=1 Tax=uncultured Ilyobacter sp. TaxID=544433 RepID=UPI0029C68595|nr:hypothetical protein [uncultured Ilyobacter sp.]
MVIELKKIILDLKNGQKNLEFEKLYENSYKEALTREVLKKKEKIHWAGVFHIEDDEIKMEFSVNTRGNFITYLDLDGYLNGEVAEIDDGSSFHLVSKKSNIYEAMCFMEVKKLKVLPEKKLKALEYSLFPKFAQGYIASAIGVDNNVGEFMKLFIPVLSNLELIKKIDISCEWTEIIGGDRDIKERFEKFLKDYVEKELFFLYYDTEYGEMLSKKEFNELFAQGVKYNPNTEIIDLYE